MPRCQQCDTESATLDDGLCPRCNYGNEQTLVADLSSGHEPEKSQVDQPDTIAGLQVGSYEIIEEVARGGMGVIYKARHLTLNRIAAIKMILSGQFSSQEDMQRFRVEAEAAARLDHPGIIPVYEIGEEAGRAYFAMKYVEGGSLADRMQKLHDDLPQAMETLKEVALAVHHAHQRGILHRDLKPANILIGDDDRPLITDLGLAKITSSDSELTNTGAVLGTPSYMSPEQAFGNTSVTTAVDIYALGAILYEFLTGVPPYRGETVLKTILNIRESDLAPPSKVNSKVDRELELICLKCLEKNPEDRYPTALAFANDLVAWSNQEPLSIRPPSWRTRARLWFQKNRQVAYFGFAVLMGILVTTPFALNFIAGQNFVRVYDYFPEESRPWLFSLGHLPRSVNAAGGLILIFFLWPTIGFLNSYVSRPRSAWRALGIGSLTSLLLVIVFTLLLGWMPLMRLTHDDSKEKTLTQALWPKAGQNADYRRRLANEMYPGLEKVPFEQRSDVVAIRLHSDRLASAPQAMLIMLLIECCVMLPVIYGTVLGYFLLNRGQRIWFSFLRYTASWWLITMMIISFLFILQSLTSTQSDAVMSTQLQFAIFILSGILLWCTVRRWKKNEETDPVPV